MWLYENWTVINWVKRTPWWCMILFRYLENPLKCEGKALVWRMSGTYHWRLENQFCLDLCKLMCSTRANDGVWTKKVFFRLCQWIDLYSVVIEWQGSYEMLQKAIDKNLRNAIQNIEITTVSTRGRMGMTFATVSRDGPVRLVKFLN